SALRGGTVPPRDQIATGVGFKVDYSFWLEWAKGLPDLPEAQPLPDPGVLERICVVIQDLQPDDYDERREAFDDQVWDKVAEQYGRHVPNVGDEQVIEGISVESRATVLALVLDGLSRYELMNQVKVICSEPDPEDWQRDRDGTVWPQVDAAAQGTSLGGD